MRIMFQRRSVAFPAPVPEPALAGRVILGTAPAEPPAVSPEDAHRPAPEAEPARALGERLPDHALFRFGEVSGRAPRFILGLAAMSSARHFGIGMRRGMVRPGTGIRDPASA